MFKDMIWHGRVLWGMMVYDSLKAVDYLVTRPDVDVARLATVGMSMGSSSAQWLGALDPRIKVVVDICCLTDWHTLVEVGGLKGHGIYYYVPDLLNHFTTAQMNALIAPRPHLSLAGNQDHLTPAARTREGGPGTQERVRRSRKARQLEAAALRRRPPGDGRYARRNSQMVRGAPVIPLRLRRTHCSRGSRYANDAPVPNESIAMP